MAGIRAVPKAATSALAEPEMPPKIILATTLTTPRPPRTQPTIDWVKSIIRRVTPPEFIRLPARMKKGIAISTKLLMPENIFCGKMMEGMLPPVTSQKAMGITPRIKAMGMPIRTRATNNTTTNVIIRVLPPLAVHGQRRVLKDPRPYTVSSVQTPRG